MKSRVGNLCDCGELHAALGENGGADSKAKALRPGYRPVGRRSGLSLRRAAWSIYLIGCVAMGCGYALYIADLMMYRLTATRLEERE